LGLLFLIPQAGNAGVTREKPLAILIAPEDSLALVPAKIFMMQPNVVPHLLPPGRQAERKEDTQIVLHRRAENAGGG